MTDKATAMVMGSFIGDALALGAHWVYNTNVIDKKFGTAVDRYQDPIASYHSGKSAGDFTHYGDQQMFLLESLAETNGYDAGQFARKWRLFFQNYSGYFDQATKTTLQNMAGQTDLQNCGSPSDDLAGAARLAPLVYVYHADPDKLDRYARSQTAVTHNNEHVLEAAKLLALAAADTLNGRSPTDAIQNVLSAHAFSDNTAELVRKGIDSRGKETRGTIHAFGQMCSVEAALPGTVHLIATYENDFKRALVENVRAGGDSAARGMLVGMVLGAHLGMDALADFWLDELKTRNRIKDLLKTLNR